MVRTLIAAIATVFLGCGAAFSQIGTGGACPLATRHNLAAWHNNRFAGPIGRHSPRYHGTRVARTQFGAMMMAASKVEYLRSRLRMNGVFSMNRAFVTRRIARIGFAAVLLSLATGFGIANAQTGAPMEAPATLNAVDFNFVGQANLGAPFQVDSGRLAEKKGGSTAIRNYAHLMVTSHIPVADALTAILQRKNVTPSNTLLHGAYDAMISTLKADHGAAFDRDYVNGQVEYQKGNGALFRQEIEYGSDPELKQFASQTLPKIEDHLQRALRLAGASSGDSTSN
jgi:putative membrane protein